MQKKRIVIVGGGFAGINLVQKLAKDQRFEITLVDKNNYNFFPPLLYQVATGFLEVSSISYPFRKFFHNIDNVRFSLGDLVEVVPSQNLLRTNTGDIPYDVLVLATGTETNYFGMENVKRNAVPMKTIKDALVLRNHILMQLEKATKISDKDERRKFMTFVISGGGPTGVEVSGLLAEMHKNIFHKDYPELDKNEVKIFLVDAGPAVLGPMSKKSQEESLAALQKLGINVLLNTPVRDYSDYKVTLGNGEVIETATLIWASGVVAREIPGLPANAIGRGRRILVDGYNKVEGTDNIYAVGDACLLTSDPKFPNGHPQVAQVAIQQGRNLAQNLRAEMEGKTMRAFTYKDNGSMAIIGTNKAVADLPGLHFKGFIAYLMWLFIHLFSLVKYRSRVRTFYNWMIAFFTRDQSMRFIIDNRKPEPEV